MKDKLMRTKKFVTNHRTALVATTTFVAGVATTVYLLPTGQSAAVLQLSVDQAKSLLENPDGYCVTFDTPRQLCQVIVDTTL